MNNKLYYKTDENKLGIFHFTDEDESKVEAFLTDAVNLLSEQDIRNLKDTLENVPFFGLQFYVDQGVHPDRIHIVENETFEIGDITTTVIEYLHPLQINLKDEMQRDKNCVLYMLQSFEYPKFRLSNTIDNCVYGVDYFLTFGYDIEDIQVIFDDKYEGKELKKTTEEEFCHYNNLIQISNNLKEGKKLVIQPNNLTVNYLII